MYLVGNTVEKTVVHTFPAPVINELGRRRNRPIGWQQPTKPVTRMRLPLTASLWDQDVAALVGRAP
eukprot:8343508-Pyramimonas_sp.AAC.1